MPTNAVGLRRGVIYVAALVIGVVLDYAITLDPMGPRAFRIGVFLIFGAPLFAWLLFHLAHHHRRATSSDQRGVQIIAIVTAVVLLALYTLAILTPRVV